MVLNGTTIVLLSPTVRITRRGPRLTASDNTEHGGHVEHHVDNRQNNQYIDQNTFPIHRTILVAAVDNRLSVCYPVVKRQARKSQKKPPDSGIVRGPVSANADTSYAVLPWDALTIAAAASVCTEDKIGATTAIALAKVGDAAFAVSNDDAIF